MPKQNVGKVLDVAEVRGAPEGWLHREWFDGRSRRQLAKSLGISQFGVNFTSLQPGAYSALRHWHTGEDEFIYVLEGELTLIDDDGMHTVGAGSFCAFPAGEANAHHLKNMSNAVVSFLEIGSRKRPGDVVHYPDDDFGPISR